MRPQDMTKSIFTGLLLLLSLAASPAADAKEPPAAGENARLWLNFVKILEVDGEKPKFHTNLLDVAPGEHTIALQTTSFELYATRWTEYRVNTVLEKDHTYAWQYDQEEEALVFVDLGRDFLVPKLGLISTSKKYKKALVDARAMPRHRVVFIPKSDWKK
jgi:hypothetical protein